MKRTAKGDRKTSETEVTLEINLDGSGESEVHTSVPFLDHMLTLFAKHALFDLHISARGDTDVDCHHTVEDVGLCLGQAIAKALGDAGGIARFGHASVPMMEALAEASLDLSGRPHLSFDLDLRGKVGQFDVELVEEFFRALVNKAGLTLHVRLPVGGNTHHAIEAIFKAFARAMYQAVALDPRVRGVPSTKGTL